MLSSLKTFSCTDWPYSHPLLWSLGPSLLPLYLFLNWADYYYYWVVEVLYILEISYFSDICIISILSWSGTCFFIFLVMSFNEQRFFLLCSVFFASIFACPKVIKICLFLCLLCISGWIILLVLLLSLWFTLNKCLCMVWGRYQGSWSAPSSNMLCFSPMVVEKTFLSPFNLSWWLFRTSIKHRCMGIFVDSILFQ